MTYKNEIFGNELNDNVDNKYPPYRDIYFDYLKTHKEYNYEKNCYKAIKYFIKKNKKLINLVDLNFNNLLQRSEKIKECSHSLNDLEIELNWLDISEDAIIQEKTKQDCLKRIKFLNKEIK